MGEAGWVGGLVTLPARSCIPSHGLPLHGDETNPSTMARERQGSLEGEEGVGGRRLDDLAAALLDLESYVQSRGLEQQQQQILSPSPPKAVAGEGGVGFVLVPQLGRGGEARDKAAADMRQGPALGRAARESRRAICNYLMNDGVPRERRRHPSLSILTSADCISTT